MSKLLQYVYYLALGSLLLLSSSAFAINGRTTYQAKIYKPDGLPLEAVSVNFRFSVLDPSSSCVLYVEDYAAVNMIGSGGLTSFSLGMGTRTYPASGPVTFASVFDNSVPSFVCQVPGVYNPVSTDNRKIVMQFNEGTGWQTLPAMAINSVPYSMYSAKAQNAQQLNGKADTSFVEYSALAALNCQSNEAIKFNGVSFSCIAVGVSSSGISSVTTSGTVLTTTGTASAPVISINVASMSNDGYLTSVDYAEFKAKLSASSTQIVNTLGYAPVSGAAVSSQIQASQLSGDVSGTVSANVVQSVGGKTAAQVSTSVNDTLAATSSATADTIVKRNSSGNITVNDIYANAAKVNYVDIYKPSTSFNIRLEAPTSLAANYTLALPTTSGSVGQVLSTDGSGNLSWINPSTGSVTSVSAVAPLSSTGGATPTISISQATSSTNGYLSSVDWNTFNNKQQATSAAIIATLGYTPANATSSTQWTTNGSHIYYNTGNVGIGVSNPVHALDVFGTIRAGAANNGSVSMGSDGNAFMELREYDNAGTPYIDFANDNSIDYDARFVLSSDDTFELNGAMFGIGLRPTAVLSLAAGTATYGPLKFTSGTLLTSPQSGTMEYDGSNFYLTDGANQRRVIATGSSQGSIDNTSQINSTSNLTLNPTGSVVVSSSMSVNGNITANANLTTSGSLGVGTPTPGEKLDVAGNMRIGNSDSNYIAFRGTTADGAGSYDHTYIGERIYAPTESSELFIFKGNDSDNASGPDRIRMAAGNIAFDTFTTPDAPSGTFEAVASSPLITTKMIVRGNGNVGIGTISPSVKTQISGTNNGALELLRLENTDANGRQSVIGFKNTGLANPTTKIYGGGATNGGDGTFKLTLTNPSGIEQNVIEATNSSGIDPKIMFSTVGTERMRIDYLGNVGIGTTTPTEKLEVSGAIKIPGIGQIGPNGGFGYGMFTAGTNNFIGQMYGSVSGVQFTNSAGANTVLIKENGNVGIGTTTPVARLHIEGSGGTINDGLIIRSTTGGNQFGFYTSLNDFHLRSVTGGADVLTATYSGSVGIGTTSPNAKLAVTGVSGNNSGFLIRSPNAVQQLDIMPGYRLDGTANGVQEDLTMTIRSSGSSPGNLALATGNNEAMRIVPSGSVGIGTTSPDRSLEVSGTIEARDANTGGATDGAIRIKGNTSSGYYGGSYGTIQFVNQLGNTQWATIIGNSVGNLLLQANGGNVGIGTATPSYKLQVNGAVAMGDAVSGNSDASLTPLINHYLGGTGDIGAGSVAYILLAYNQTAANGITASGFDGQIYSYRGTAGSWNNATRMDIALKTAYDAPAVHRFSVDGPLANAVVVTLTYSGTSYIGVQVPSSSAMDYYITGRFWGFKPILLDSVNHGASISAVTEVSKPLISTVGGRVGVGTGNPQEKLHVEAPVAGRIQVGTGDIFATSGYGVSLESDTDDGVAYINLHTQAVGANASALVIRGGHGAAETAATRSIASFRTDSGNVGIGYNAPTSKLQVNGGIKQPNYGQLVSIWDGTTRTTTMPAFLTSTYMEDHQEETYTWRGIGPRFKDTAGCSIGPTGNYFFDGFDTTWNGVYRMTLGKLSGTTYIAEVEWRGWGTNLKDAASATVSTSSNQGTIQATLSWNGSVWTVEHMQGQVGTTPFSCH